MPDDQQVIDTPSTDPIVANLRVALQQERDARKAATERATLLESESAKALAEANTKLAQYEPDAKRWGDHVAAQAKALDGRNAERMQALPERLRSTLATLDREALAAALDDLATLTPPATQATPEKPQHPAGGAVQQPGGIAAELTTAEKQWAESKGLDVTVMTVDGVRQLAKTMGGPSSR